MERRQIAGSGCGRPVAWLCWAEFMCVGGVGVVMRPPGLAPLAQVDPYLAILEFLIILSSVALVVMVLGNGLCYTVSPAVPDPLHTDFAQVGNNFPPKTANLAIGQNRLQSVANLDATAVVANRQ